MTTIAGDPRLGILCADSNVSDGAQKWTEDKIERIGDTLYGTCGDAVDGEKFLEWIRAGARGRKPKLDATEFNALALNAKGLFWFDSKLHPVRHKTAFAIGSGAAPFRSALIALRECGWSGNRPDVERAMEIACEVDAGSALPIKTYRIQEEKTA